MRDNPYTPAASNSVTLTHTLESLNNLIDLYEAWNKPEKAKEWREELAQKEDFEE